MKNNKQNEKENLKLKPKYQFQRQEQRKIDRRNNNGNEKGNKERSQMERMSNRRISIGTITFFKPKPTTEIKAFTLAFSKPLSRNKVHLILERIFNEKMFNKNSNNEKMIKSIFVNLENQVQFKEIQKRVKQNFDEII